MDRPDARKSISNRRNVMRGLHAVNLHGGRRFGLCRLLAAALTLIVLLPFRGGELGGSVRAQFCPCPDFCDPSLVPCGAEGRCQVTGPTDWCTYVDGCPAGQQVWGTCCYIMDSPILIDVANDGFELTNAVSGVWFPIGPNSFMYQVAWTYPDSDDAWLALDRNGNGTIDNGQELFGNFTPQPEPPQGQAKNGFLGALVSQLPT